ncbi:hypothetical protein XPA_005041 [Xanthoria parietina]
MEDGRSVIAGFDMTDTATCSDSATRSDAHRLAVSDSGRRNNWDSFDTIETAARGVSAVGSDTCRLAVSTPSRKTNGDTPLFHFSTDTLPGGMISRRADCHLRS